MKKMFFLSIMLVLASCSSINPRKISSVDKEIAGNYLGVGQYSLNKAATRLYLQEIEGEKGSYLAVLLEYVNLIGMAPKYILSNKSQTISKKIGFLKNITRNISTYKVVPGSKENTYEMWPLAIVGEQILADQNKKPRILTLSKMASADAPLAGATISKVNDSEPNEIFFPIEDDEKINGLQYNLAKFFYNKVKLESTWRDSFLPGLYLSQYANVDDVVLKLKGSGDNLMAEFVLNPKVASMPEKKRKAMFTNEKSAFLKGEYEVSEPAEGMFLFKAVNEVDEKSSSIIGGRIGLFIDIFDASKALNKDVVELALINPNNHEDFLMYYEHPENGEGKDHN